MLSQACEDKNSQSLDNETLQTLYESQLPSNDDIEKKVLRILIKG
jgi:hypothetical protein